MRGKIRTIIGTLLIIIGVALIGVTIWMKYETKREQQAMIDSFKDLGEDSNNATSSENDNGKVSAKAIALLDIPKLDLEIGIVEGVSIKDIKYAVGHFPQSVMPGEKGNFAIAGHRVSNFGQPFRHAEELVPGDEIKVKYKGKEYIYEVTESFEVTPKDTYVLENTKEPTITIVTCTIGAKNRLIIKGKLK